MNIQNDQLSLSVTLNAAEMTSLIDKKTGKEILWQGDPAYWAGRNPILFPIVGSTFDNKIHLFGKEYVMGNHGFTRNSTFEPVSQTENQIILVLKDNPVTLAQYPFHFALSVVYTLTGSTVKIEYYIENKDEKEMPFSFGLHPAFAIDDPNAALIKFEKKEEVPALRSGEPIRMDDDYFRTLPTFLLEYLKSEYIDLIRGDLTVRVAAKGYRWLAFWKKPGAKFICIEPWHGHGDHGAVTTDFYKREGTIVLKPGQIYTTAYSITIL